MNEANLQHDLHAEQREIARYLKARQEWDSLYGTARHQAMNWRYMSFFLAGLLLLSLMVMAYLGTLPKQAIHVIEVDKLGKSVYVGKAGTPGAQYRATEAAKIYHLKRFIEDVRSLPSDPVVVKRQWEDAYKLVTQSGGNILTTYARSHVPTERIKKVRVAIEGLTLIPISDHSWSAEWREITWNTKGEKLSTKKWKGIFNLVFQEPTNQKQREANPIGLYVDSFNWTETE